MAALAPAATASPAQRRARALRAGAGAATCAAAAGIGVLAGHSPSDALAAVAVLAFVPIVLLRFTIGVGLFTVSTFIGLSGTAQKGIGAVVVLVAVGRLIAQPAATPNFLSSHRRLAALVAVYLAWCVLGLTWATSTGDVLYSLERYTPNFLVFLIVFAAARDRLDVRLLAAFFVLGSAVAITDAILHPQSAGAAYRLAGQFGDPNYLAAVLVTGFSLSLALATARPLPELGRLAAAAVAALCMLGILLSVSRGGLVALAVSLLVAVAIAGRWRGRLAFAGAIVVVVGAAYFLAFAPASARQRLTSTAGGGSGRTTIWRVGWREVRANPLLGVGAGNFSTAGARYVLRPGLINHTASGYTAYFLDTPTVAHNTYLEVLAEEGVPGALVFLSIIVVSLRCAWLAGIELRARGDDELELISYGVICGTVGFLAASFFLSEEYSKQLYLLLAMGPALLGVARRAPSGARSAMAAQA